MDYNSGSFARLALVRRDESRKLITIVILFFRIDDRNDFLSSGRRGDVLQEFFVNDSLAIIRNNDPVVARRAGRDKLAYFSERSALDGPAAFAVQAHDLLMVRAGDNAAFLNGLKVFVRNHTRGRRAGTAQCLQHASARIIATDDPTGSHPSTERADVLYDIRRAAKA